MNVPFLDLQRQARVPAEVLLEVLHTGRYLSGPRVHAFETAFAAYCGSRECVTVANGTDALDLALRAAGVRAGDEVATVANAGMYSTTAIRLNNAVPVYVDIHPRTLLMDPEKLAASIGPKTRAIIVTHLYGRVANLDALAEAARGLPVIEDCAQAHGAVRNVRGVAACFSFYPTKNLGAYGDGGAVVTDHAAIADRLRALREYGWTKRFHSTVPGGRNSRMDEIQAAVLYAKLPLLDGWNERRRGIAAAYDAALADVGGIERTGPVDKNYVAHLYVVRVRERASLQSWLTSQGIASDIHYPIPDPEQESQRGLPWRTVTLDVTRQATAEVLSLPCFPELHDAEVEYVIDRIRAWKP